jgi:alkanesulfonate monooxygenase SsuD/methylene tetrahydromethanopterin reductase-like flavin-dependent oxidoreductase (luciferase family)
LTCARLTRANLAEECWSILTALAAATSQIELGSAVAASSFRNPALLAKMAETTDEISGGRLILGLGTGNHEPEFRAFGYPYDYRVSRFAEAIQIIHGLLRHGAIDFDGRFYQARDCELRPRGPCPGGPPIMIRSSRPRMLELAARYADAWNTWGRPAEAIAPLRATVDAACTAVGRDPATMMRTAAVMVQLPPTAPYAHDWSFWNARFFLGEPLVGPPEVLAEACCAYAREGIHHLQIWLEPLTPAGVEALAPVLALLDGA